MTARHNPRREQGGRRDRVRREVMARGEPCWICGLPIDWGIRAGDPRAGEVDEIVPVSRGGSPYDPANCAGAHRVCNEWRGARAVAQVRAVQAQVLASGAPIASPMDWTRTARLLARGKQLHTVSPPRPTTDW